MTTLFDAGVLGSLDTPNRMVMAPMIRGRADSAGVPSAATADYYAQRSSAGLIVAEGTFPNAAGRGYSHTPGLHTPQQVAGWRRVTEQVHAVGGRIFVQLMHAGRISHADLHGGALPVAPSAVRPARAVLNYEGRREFNEPRALTDDEVERTVADFAAAAGNALSAGFDGVEIHAANGYLLHQFLSVNANRRTEGRYGGSIPNRARMVLETAEAVTAAVGAHRVGIRMSPGSIFNDIDEGDTEPLYRYLLPRIAPLGLAYLHILENGGRAYTRLLRELWPGALVLNPRAGCNLVHPGTGALAPQVGVEAAEEALAEGVADFIAFGRGFIANPDLPRRLAEGAALNEVDAATLYPGDRRGYTDYPTLESAARSAADSVPEPVSR
jgi:N-ethylmaleimide reductase